jgi:uncharacterized membrane protein (DUF4010 family)
MDFFSVDLEAFKILAEGLAIGMLVGVERYKGRQPGQRESAGVRTFAVFGLMGAVSGLLGSAAFALATFGACAVLVAIGYYRSAASSLGLTTETAALLVFWLGYLLHSFEVLAISTAIVLTIILASKGALHRFIQEQISETELFDTLKFLAVVLVVFPLLPDRDLGPYGFFNPREVWLLVILVSAISFAGYLLIRVLGSRRGLRLSALAGGLVSTTATTLSLAARARRNPHRSRTLGVAAVLANAVQSPRVLFLLWVVSRRLGVHLVAPLLAMGAVGILGSWLLSRRHQPGTEAEAEFALQNPFSLAPALKFGLYFTGILALVEVASAWLGQQGFYMASAVGGLGSVSAVTLSLADQVERGALQPAAAAHGVLLAIATNAALKWVLALVQGTRELAFWLGGGLLSMLTAGSLILVFVF